jgi:hypothetical protein
MNDINIEKLVYEIDDMFTQYLKTLQVDPLVLSTILLARMIRMNDACESGKEFRQILSESYKKAPVESEIVRLH